MFTEIKVYYRILTTRRWQEEQKQEEQKKQEEIENKKKLDEKQKEGDKIQVGLIQIR